MKSALTIEKMGRKLFRTNREIVNLSTKISYVPNQNSVFTYKETWLCHNDVLAENLKFPLRYTVQNDLQHNEIQYRKRKKCP